MLVLAVHMTYSNLILETFYNTSLKKAWKMVDNLDTLIKPLIRDTGGKHHVSHK